jgi:hypothetical protein
MVQVTENASGLGARQKGWGEMAMTANVPVRRYKIDDDYSSLIEEGGEWYRATDFDALAADNARLKAALLKYGQHEMFCVARRTAGVTLGKGCTCGLDIATPPSLPDTKERG